MKPREVYMTPGGAESRNEKPYAGPYAMPLLLCKGQMGRRTVISVCQGVLMIRAKWPMYKKSV